MLESRRLRHFLTVYELGSIGQAAERLLLTQPALSKSIRQLESDLGVRLFDRTTLGVIPTVYGNALALHAKTIDAEVRRAEAQILSLRGKARGQVSVGVGPSVAANLMPLATLSLHQLHPDIELNVTEGLIDDILPMLRRGEIQVAVGAWPEITEAIFNTELLIEDMIEVYGGVDHPLVGTTVSLKELLEHPWALPPSSQRWRQNLDDLFFAQGLSPPKPSVTSNSASYLKELMRRGGYLSFLPRQLVGDRTGLAIIETDIPKIRPSVTMTYRERSLLDAPCGEFVQAMRSAAAEIVT